MLHFHIHFPSTLPPTDPFLLYNSLYCIYSPFFLSFYFLSVFLPSSSFHYFFSISSLLHYLFFFFIPLFLFHLAISFRPFTPAPLFLCRSSSSISVKGADAALINAICQMRARNLCVGKLSIAKPLLSENIRENCRHIHTPSRTRTCAPFCLSGSRTVIYSADTKYVS